MVLIDTNILDYLSAAMLRGETPATQDTHIQVQQTASLRLFLWGAGLGIGRIAAGEAGATPSEAKRWWLQRLIDNQLPEVWVQPEDRDRWRTRAAELCRHHAGVADCLLVAEAEIVGAGAVLSFDKTMVRRLRPHARVRLMFPTEYWDELAIPRGTPPRWAPAPSNPLSPLSFWRWASAPSPAIIKSQEVAALMVCPHCLQHFHAAWSGMIELVDDPPVEAMWLVRHTTCPACRRPTIVLPLRNRNGSMRDEMMVQPRGVSRAPLPPEVVDPYRQDYAEACAVLVDSPKASAALSRRCLQALLRDKGGFRGATLDAEIQLAINSQKLPPYIVEALDAVRVVGNFAAHPTKSTATGAIIDVEPAEAETNLDTIEALFDFYFVQPEIQKKKRDALNAKLQAAGKPPLK